MALGSFLRLANLFLVFARFSQCDDIAKDVSSQNLTLELEQQIAQNAILLENIEKIISGCNCPVCREDKRLYLLGEQWNKDCEICTCQEEGRIECALDKSRAECSNPCVEDPCLHGGSCQTIEDGFECECPPSYYGTRCQNRVDCCSEPPRYGLCMGNHARWFFNTSTVECQTFIYSGCGGSFNTFQTMSECVNTCERGACCYKTKSVDQVNCELNSRANCKDNEEIETVAFHVGWPGRNPWRTQYEICSTGIDQYRVGANFSLGCHRECVCESNGVIACPTFSGNTRLEFRNLTYYRWKDFVGVVKTLRLSGLANSWQRLADTYTSHHQHATKESNFLLWNRMFLKYAESAFQSVNCEVTIPYWDFTLEEGNLQSSVLWSGSKMGRPVGDCVRRHGFQNITVTWEPCLKRRFDNGAKGPTKIDVTIALSKNDFTEFTKDVQAMVEKINNILGIDDTPYDPVFYLIRAYVDMLFTKWQERHRECKFETTKLDSILYPFKDRTFDLWNVSAKYQVVYEWYDNPDPCFPNACLHGGSCIRTNQTRKFKCDCTADFEGPLCERGATMRCYQPLNVGKGQCQRTERWYFDWTRNNCYQFNYTGCLPRDNNFASRYDCKVTCTIGACCWKVPLHPGRPDGYDSAGFDKFGRHWLNSSRTIKIQTIQDKYFTSKRLDCQGYDARGFNYITGFNLTGYNSIGDHDGLIDYDERGFDQDGYDRDGFNCHGVSRRGYDRCGFSAGYTKECRAMPMVDCQNVHRVYPYLKRKVVQFAAGERCESVDCSNVCTCSYLNETYNLNQKFEIGPTVCECQRGGVINCNFEETVRKEIRDFNSLDWFHYQEAIRSLNQGPWPTKWRRLTIYYSKFLSHSRNEAHFLPWHRFFLKIVESELRSYNSNVTIPYYDWTMDQNWPRSLLWQANVMGGNGDPSNAYCVKYLPFALDLSPCLRRNFSTHHVLPNKVYLELVQREQNASVYFSKMRRVGVLFHQFVGGNMATPYCFYDPVFLSFYAYMDKLWSDWESRHEPVYYPDRYVPMEPFSISTEDVLGVKTKVKYLTTEQCECIVQKVNETNYHLEGYTDGYDEMGWDYTGYDREGYNRDGYDKLGFNQGGFNRYGIHKNGCVKRVKCDGTVGNQTTYDQFGFDSGGLDFEGSDQYGFDLEGYDRNDCNYAHLGPFYPKITLEYEKKLRALSTETLKGLNPIMGTVSNDSFLLHMWMEKTEQDHGELYNDVPIIETPTEEIDYWLPIRFRDNVTKTYCPYTLCFNKTCPFNTDVYCKVKNKGNCSVEFIHKLTGTVIHCPDNYCEHLGKYYLNGSVYTRDDNATCQRCFCKEGKMDCWLKERCSKKCTHGFDSNTSCCSPCTDCNYHDYLLVNGQQFTTPNNPCELCSCVEGNVSCVDVRPSCPKLNCLKTEILRDECCPVCLGCRNPAQKTYIQHGDQLPDTEDKCKNCFCTEGEIKCYKKSCGQKCRNPLVFDCCPDCTGCYYKGMNYTNGSSVYDFDTCKNCSCKNGNVECQTTICPTLNCTKSTPIPGQCCAVCKDCQYEGIEYKDEEEFHYKGDPCTKCQCGKGLVKCEKLDSTCGAACSHAVKVPGQCCPVCDKGCQLGSKLYEKNEIFSPISSDPCFYCNCSNGNINCHNVTCAETNCLTSVKRLGECCPVCTCEVGNAVYQEGQKWNSTRYKCEECICMNSRPYCYRLECPLAKCPNPAAPYGVCCPECNHCAYKRRLYRNGQHFTVNDGECEKCFCENGTVVCHKNDCQPPLCTNPVQLQNECCPVCDQGCLLEGKLLKHADKFHHPQEKCLDCKCNSGNVTCSRRKCPEIKCLHPAIEDCCPQCNHCEYQGDLINNGENVPVNDECTICTCENGTVVCRAKKCPPYNCKTPILRNCCPVCVEGCYHNGNTHNIGEEFETPDKPCEKCICIEDKKKIPRKTESVNGNVLSNWIDFQEGSVHCYKKPCGPVLCKNPKPGVCCPVCTGTCMLGSYEMQNGTSLYDPQDTCNHCSCLDGKLECTIEVCPKLVCAVSVRNAGECCETCKGCVYEGEEYNSGSSWTSVKDPCVSCQCDGGIVSCAQLQCVVPCVNPVPVPGQCCPMCPGCTVGSKLYKSGETFNPNDNPCEICTCESGQLLCLSQHCPPLIGCPKESVKPARDGECCPTCSGLSTACHENDIENLKHPTNDPCFTCECKDSTWICIRQICPRVNCPEEFLVRPTGECCATCSVCESEEDQQIYENNTVWIQKDDPCLKCSCQNGKINCTKELCPLLHCQDNENLVKQVEQCCGQCVNQSDLSCIYSDEIYKNGEVWKLDTCTECNCSNQIVKCHTERCVPLRCPNGYTPTIDPGLCCPKCILKPATCAAFGDPHYRTFDGHIIHFQGTCRYTLAKDCDSGNFTVEVQNSDRGKKVVSWTESVHVDVGGTKIDLYKGPIIMVNQEQVTVPYLYKSHFYIEPAGTSVLLSSNVGVQVIWDGESFVEVSVSGNYGNKVCGLCGNFNSYPQDDLRLPGGQIATSEVYFGDSWKTNGQQLESCQKTEQIDPCSHGGYKAVKLANTKCSVLKSSVFKPCHKVFPPEPYYSSCVYDLCACWETFDCLCDILETYSRKCSEAGVILNWRKPGLCDIGCPKELGLIFDECGPPCPRTCENKDVPLGVLDAQCFKPCISGCQCPADKVLHRGKCIKVEQCPNV